MKHLYHSLRNIYSLSQVPLPCLDDDVTAYTMLILPVILVCQSDDSLLLSYIALLLMAVKFVFFGGGG